MNQKSPLEVKIVTLVALTSLDKKHLESLIADRTYRIDGVERCEAVDPPAVDHTALGGGCTECIPDRGAQSNTPSAAAYQ